MHLHDVFFLLTKLLFGIWCLFEKQIFEREIIQYLLVVNFFFIELVLIYEKYI